MSVTTTATKISYEFKPDTSYSLPFEYQSADDVKVSYEDDKGSEVLLNYGSDYTVENLIVTVSASLPEGTVLNFYRNTDIVQPTVFPPQVLTQAYETAIDRNTMCIQEVKTDFGELREEVEDFEKKTNEEIDRFESEVTTEIENFEKETTERIEKFEENAEKVIEQAQASAESALASKNAAAASQSSAAASAETAQASAESASSSADAALASKNAALTSENNAKASETKSAKSEENAKAAETAAENSKKSASDSASAASSSAESALESKTLAAASANSASASKTSAESSAKSAASSATTATRQADRAQGIADSLEGLAGITGIATTDEAIAGVVDTKAMTPLKTKKAIEQGTNVFTALNTFRAGIRVSNGSAAGSGGGVSFGISPTNEPIQARITADNLGGLFYHVSTGQAHVFRNGSNLNSLAIRVNDKSMYLSSNDNIFAAVDYTGVAKWLGNANTATKLETARTINGVAFDGTKDIIVDSNPVGTIIAVAYTGVPEGYMHCNGAAVNRTTYVNLFNKIGTTYGAGDGSTTFNLPNTVARFLEGGIGAGTYYEAGLPNITGNISAFNSSISGAFVGSNNTSRYDGWNDNEDEYAVSTSFDASRSNSIYGASTTVQPPAMTVIYCIKY